MGDERRELAGRLREKAPEIEEAIFDRIRALEEAGSGPRRLQGLRGVIGPVVEHGLLAVEVGERRSPEPPPAAIAHARKAAWRSVPTHTLHERYTAGYSVFRRFLGAEIGSPELAREVHSSTDVVFERLICAVGEEHERERRKRGRSLDVYRLERVEELLSGGVDEAPELGGIPSVAGTWGSREAAWGSANPPPAVYQRIPVPRMEQMAATSK